jgi:hypothetical protein
VESAAGHIVIILIVYKIRRKGHLHHQVFALAIARHHKQMSIPLPHMGFEEGLGAATFCTPLYLAFGALGLANGFIPMVFMPVRHGAVAMTVRRIVTISKDGGRLSH